MKKYILIFSILLSLPLIGEEKKDVKSSSEEIEVKGQTRNFNMTLMLKTKKDKISFVKTRRDFKEEILATEP